MKSALTVVLFRLFTMGVFVDGNKESVSVTEGNSVTLKSGVTEIQTDDEIEWRFSGSKIATISRDSSGISLWVKPDGSFKDRLQLNNQTGDLKISNIRTTDSGLYKVKISSTRGSSEIIFTVKVVSADEVKSVSVMEGDSITLHTDLTEIQTDVVIQWRFGQQKSLVAEINRKAGIFTTSEGPDERFRDRLQLDHQTGSLTIRDLTTTDSGLYEVEISSTSSRYTIHHTQSFNVTVSDAVTSVKEGESVTLPITEIQNDDLILWMFGNIRLAEIHKAEQRFYVYAGPDERFRNRLQLDPQTGSLIITNTRTRESGEYRLKISSSRHSINRKINVTVSGSGRSDPDSVSVLLDSDLVSGRSDPDSVLLDSDSVLLDSDSVLLDSDSVLLDSDSVLLDSDSDSGRSDSDLDSGRSDSDLGSDLHSAVPCSGLPPAAVAGIVVGGVLLGAAVVVMFNHCKFPGQKRKKVIHIENEPSQIQLSMENKYEDEDDL